MLSIRIWVPFLIGILLVLVMGSLIVFSYQNFEKSLDERVMLQLTSIKKLKRGQIETYISASWDEFMQDEDDNCRQSFSLTRYASLEGEFDTTCTAKSLKFRENRTGIYDMTACNNLKETSIVLYNKAFNKPFAVLNFDPIQEILLERTGMGETGESYLVGNDRKLKSKSRFFPDIRPQNITVDTEGVKAAFQDRPGHQIIKDYRDILVYSAYHIIEIQDLKWVILSEIDLNEVDIPLVELRNRLLTVFISVVLLAILGLVVLSKVFTGPLLKIRGLLLSMTSGDYSLQISTKSRATEINEMFVALDQLKRSINEAILFCTEISSMNLEADYAPTSQQDRLGISLLEMRSKLIAFQALQQKNKFISKESLIKGQERERKRLSQELHDGLGPLLTAIKLNVELLQIPESDKNRIEPLVNKTIDEVRNMSYDLMPLALVDFGAGVAVERYIQLIRSASTIEFIYQNELHNEGEGLSDEVNIALFRISQELVNNALKHAKSKKVILTISEFEDKVALFYLDDGVGFDPNASFEGYGLRNLRDRVEILSGNIVVTRRAEGMQYEIEIPLRNGED